LNFYSTSIIVFYDTQTYTPNTTLTRRHR
jgi:hypothetical protein